MEFLDQIDALAHSVRKASRWHRTQEPFASVLTDLTKTATPDYAFEIHCIATILDMVAQQGYVVVMIPSAEGDNVYSLPKKAALKSRFSRFEIWDHEQTNCLVQICCGTEITGLAGEPKAPDISFQKGDSPLSPNSTHVYFVHDTKFVEGGDCSKKISSMQFATASQMIRDLSLARALDGFPDFGLPLELCSNCILTNGLAHKDNISYHQLNFIRCVTCFPPLNEAKIIG